MVSRQYGAKLLIVIRRALSGGQRGAVENREAFWVDATPSLSFKLTTDSSHL